MALSARKGLLNAHTAPLAACSGLNGGGTAIQEGDHVMGPESPPFANSDGEKLVRMDVPFDGSNTDPKELGHLLRGHHNGYGLRERYVHS